MALVNTIGFGGETVTKGTENNFLGLECTVHADCDLVTVGQSLGTTPGTFTVGAKADGLTK